MVTSRLWQIQKAALNARLALIIARLLNQLILKFEIDAVFLQRANNRCEPGARVRRQSSRRLSAC